MNTKHAKNPLKTSNRMNTKQVIKWTQSKKLNKHKASNKMNTKQSKKWTQNKQFNPRETSK